MNTVRKESGSMALGLGLVLLGFGLSLLLTNLVGLWLVRHVAVLGPLVLGSWPLLLIVAGLFMSGYAVASRRGAGLQRGEHHGRG
jgi:hypothetical protein